MSSFEAYAPASTAAASPRPATALPARADEAPAVRSRPLTVLMAGPALEVMGGVSAVERLLLASLPDGVSVTHLPTMVDGGRVRKLWTFARALRRFVVELAREPAVVHIHFSVRASSVRKEILARIALARGARVIMHAHAGEYRNYWASLSDAARARSLHVFKRARALIVLGEGWREFFISIGAPAERIVVLPNPVRLPASLPARTPGRKVTCVYLGLVAPKKGVFDLLEAAASLPASCRERLRIVFAGNGQLEALMQAARERGLAGVVEVKQWLAPAERDALLAASDVFVLPSYNEGLPMSLLEAMAFGLAPITTPVGGIPEVVQQGESGILTPPGDTPALAAALRRLIEDPEERLRLGRNARAAVEPLSVERYVERLLSLYEDVARDRTQFVRHAEQAASARRRA